MFCHQPARNVVICNVFFFCLAFKTPAICSVLCISSRESIGICNIFCVFVPARDTKICCNLQHFIAVEKVKIVSKMCRNEKTDQFRITFGRCDVEKVHAFVARSTFGSQKCEKLSGSEHVLTMRWWFDVKKVQAVANADPQGEARVAATAKQALQKQHAQDLRCKLQGHHLDLEQWTCPSHGWHIESTDGPNTVLEQHPFTPVWWILVTYSSFNCTLMIA